MQTAIILPPDTMVVTGIPAAARILAAASGVSACAHSIALSMSISASPLTYLAGIFLYLNIAIKRDA